MPPPPGSHFLYSPFTHCTVRHCVVLWVRACLSSYTMLYLGNFVVEGAWFQGHVTQSPVRVRVVAGVDLGMALLLATLSDFSSHT